MSNLFTAEETEAFIKKILVDAKNPEFLEFYDRCVKNAKAETIFQFDMYNDQVMYFISQLNKADWGEITLLTPQQIAIVRLADAMCQEIHDLMIEDLLKKSKTDTPN